MSGSPALRPLSMDMSSSPNLKVPVLASSTQPGTGEQTLYREEQRISLRAFIRGYLNNPLIAQSQAMRDFLTAEQTELSEEDLADVDRRQLMDEKRVEEQRKFFEIAQERARELDVHMEKFRRDIVERSK